MKNRILKSKILWIFFLQTVVLTSNLCAATKSQGWNSWVDIPVIETIEYFTTLMAQALIWARRYALLFGLVGMIWSGIKVMMSRMAVKQMFWDTFFKWAGFTVLIAMYPMIVYGFLGLATEIGENAGMGKQMVEQDMKKLYAQVKQSETYRNYTVNEMTREIYEKTGVQLQNNAFTVHDTYISFMEKVNGELNDVPIFSSERDRNQAQQIVDEYTDALSDDDCFWFSGLTMAALNSVCTEKKLDGSDGNSLSDTYIQLQIYLSDRNGDDTMFISPAAMLRLSVLCGLVMWDRWSYEFGKENEEIDKNSNFLTKGGKKLVHIFSSIPQLVELIFCQFVLIIAIAFAMIQYIMTIIEYVIVTAIAAIFLPFMLFDGTKDIPKKFIPVMVSFMIKIIVMLVCMYFVMYLLIQHTMNTITESWGINLWAVCEVFFIAALCYILTQNAPKIAQTILTGQPQLSMGEALQGAGTAAATFGTMKQMPHAATMAAAREKAKVNTATGAIKKSNMASAAAKHELGSNAFGFQKLRAGMKARGAVATQDLKDKMHAKFEAARKESGTGIGIVDKALQVSGLSRTGVGGSNGGADGSSGAYGQTGQKNQHFLNESSNPNFKTATTTDSKTGQSRSMTNSEFQTEKGRQGWSVGSRVGKEMQKEIDEQNSKKAEQSHSLPDKLTDNERAMKN